jgi:hypothetical protein
MELKAKAKKRLQITETFISFDVLEIIIFKVNEESKCSR